MHPLVSLRPTAHPLLYQSPRPLSPLPHQIPSYVLFSPGIRPSQKIPQSSQLSSTEPSHDLPWDFADRDPEPSLVPNPGTLWGTMIKGKGIHPLEKISSASLPPFFSGPTSLAASSSSSAVLAGVDAIVVTAIVQLDALDDELSGPAIGYPADPSTHYQHHPPRRFGYYHNPELDALRRKYLDEFKASAGLLALPEKPLKIFNSDEDRDMLQPNLQKAARKSNKRPRLYRSPSSQSSL